MLDFNVAILTVEFHGIPIFAVSFRCLAFLISPWLPLPDKSSTLFPFILSNDMYSAKLSIGSSATLALV